jgi:hypothetical protein
MMTEAEKERAERAEADNQIIALVHKSMQRDFRRRYTIARAEHLKGTDNAGK